MSQAGSVSAWLEQLKAGEAAALATLGDGEQAKQRRQKPFTRRCHKELSFLGQRCHNVSNMLVTRKCY